MTALRFTRRIDDPTARIAGTVTLRFEQRRHSRLRARLDGDGGVEVGLFLPRGTVLRDGDLLVGSDLDGVVRIKAAPETVSTVRAADPVALARACYHLGNRHVPIQIGDGWVRYQHDHVLDDMVRLMGLTVGVEQAPFEPEAGAYGGGHGHDDEHGRGHGPEDRA